MNFVDDLDPGRRIKAPRAWSAAAASRRALAAMLCAALGGCGAGDGAGALLVDPGHYSAYHCSDLAARAKALAAREKELRELMQRADQGPGGGVIGSLAYRADYESVLSEEKQVQHFAAEKNCNPTQQFQSDQVIR